MPKHDLPGYATAYNAGQEDYLNNKLPMPSRHNLKDTYRTEKYMEGYEQEIEDLRTSILA